MKNMKNSKAVYMGNKIPSKEWNKAKAQWWRLSVLRLFPMVLGWFIQPIIIKFYSMKFQTNAFGEPATKYNLLKYPNASPDGWHFESVRPYWKDASFFKNFIWWFGNDEDGWMGDIRGEWSSMRNGKESSFFNKYWWSAHRNACNNFSRYSKYYACEVNHCTFEYWGDYDSPDNKPIVQGWHFVKATDSRNGSVYYGYREVTAYEGFFENRETSNNPEDWDDWAVNKSYGFKIKPEHADNVQNPDDAHKGFTWRPQIFKIEDGKKE